MGNITWLEVSQRFNKTYISGTSQRVTTSFIKAFVRDLGEHLTVLTPSELYVLFQAQGINRKEQAKFSRTFDVLIDAVQTGMVNKKDLEDWLVFRHKQLKEMLLRSFRLFDIQKDPDLKL